MTMNRSIIVGSGVFGASTALELARAGHQVVVLDRSADGYCAPDAASNDLNKIVRADYSDPHYRDLAKTAISIWRRSELYKPYYHEVGVFFHTGPTDDTKASKEYIEKAVQSAHAPSHRELPYVGKTLKRAAYKVHAKEKLRECFPSSLQDRLGNVAKDVVANSDNGSSAYFNPRGGWAEANRATRATLDEAIRLGASVVGNAHVESLLLDEQKTVARGVRCADGREFRTAGDGQVVICAGGWAESLLSSLFNKAGLRSPPPSIPTWSSAQCVLTVQLNEEQRKAFAHSPVVLEFASGFYLFEPDQNGLMKCAIHSSGFRFPVPPQTKTTPSAFPTFEASSEARSANQQHAQAKPDHVVKQDFIPNDQTKRMLEQLAYVYPELANAPVVFQRICFYSESLDENWIIDHVPSVKNVMIASGDSGHAFKFLPVLGNLVCARMGIEQAGTLTEHQKRVFSIDYHIDAKRRSAQSARESSLFKARL